MALVPSPDAADDPDRRIQLTDPDALDEGAAKMSFLDHLEELRKRIINCLISLVAGVVIAFFFLSRVVDFVLTPLQERLPEGSAFITTEAPEYFVLYIKIGLLAGLFVAMPLILWQVWLFIAPGLYSHEKRFAIPFVLMASVFFFLGGAFAHYVAFPWTWQFFIDFTGGNVQFLPKLQPTFALYVRVILAFGVVFQMPTVVFFLARMGVITAGYLVKHTKYAILIIFILAAILSPGGDIPSQLLMAGPMLILYALSIGIAWAFGKRKSA
jgi:sec-independent protein translocase protein TatC